MQLPVPDRDKIVPDLTGYLEENSRSPQEPELHDIRSLLAHPHGRYVAPGNVQFRVGRKKEERDREEEPPPVTTDGQGIVVSHQLPHLSAPEPPLCSEERIIPPVQGRKVFPSADPGNEGEQPPPEEQKEEQEHHDQNDARFHPVSPVLPALPAAARRGRNAVEQAEERRTGRFALQDIDVRFIETLHLGGHGLRAGL